MRGISILLMCCMLVACNSNKIEKVTVLEKQILPHPRLLFTAQEEAQVRKSFGTDSLLSSLRDALLRHANDLLTAEPQKYLLSDRNYTSDILTISREQINRNITLSMAYRLTGDKRYAAKVEQELNNVCDFPTWNPAHYLDVAEMTTAVAIAYDWLYDVLSPETKQKVASSIKTNALDLAVEEYKTGDNDSWAKRETNWNVVCNAGVTLGALAIAEDYPNLAEEIITNAVKYVPNCIGLFAPDGVCYEGPAYWGYTNDFLSLLLKSLDDNFQTDFGLTEIGGVNQAVMYYIHSTSPSGKIFNFANSGGTGQESDPIFFYFSKKFNQPEAAEYYRKILSKTVGNSSFSRFYFLSIPWYDPSTVTTAALPKLKVFRNSINDIVVFNGDTHTKNSIYLIAKTGEPAKAHQQEDVGTFIIETNGVRWSDDTGSDNYSLPGFWDYKPDGQRWKYFRNTNFSHNTLAIDNKIQYSAGTGELAVYDEQAAQPFVTMDLSGVYQGQASSVYRTFCLSDDTHMIVTDSVTLNNASQQVCWSMITDASVACKGNTAVLSKDGKTFFVTLLSPAGASFSVNPAKTFTPEEKQLKGYSLLKTKVTGKQIQVIKVQMSSAD